MGYRYAGRALSRRLTAARQAGQEKRHYRGNDNAPLA
jgi:hypothetical protein